MALALVRERTSGVIELFRVAPVNAWEVMAGKVLAYLLIGGLIAALTVGLLVGVFNVPMLGDPVALAVAIGLVLLASLGIGLLIAVISDSERQAVQLSLLLLLASVFFSGFVLAISEFSEPVRVLAYMLPVTHGIQLMQDIMLRGGTTQTWQYGALVLIAVVTLCGQLVRPAAGDDPCLTDAMEPIQPATPTAVATVGARTSPQPPRPERCRPTITNGSR